MNDYLAFTTLWILVFVTELLLQTLGHVIGLSDTTVCSCNATGSGPEEVVRLEVVDLVEEGVESFRC